MRDLVWLGMLLLFMVDFLLLLGSNRLCGHPPDGLRVAAASLLGACHLGLFWLPGFAFLGHWGWRAVFLCLMPMIAFGFHRSAIKRGVVFLLLQLAVIGIAMGDSFWTVTLASLLIFLLSMAGQSGQEKRYVPVTISHGGKQFEMIALRDTGNTLLDPISGKHVLVADEIAAAHLLGITARELTKPIETIASGKWRGLRLIPYSAIGQPKGLLIGLKVDSLLVDGKQCDNMVAFAPQKIGRVGSFQALVGGMV